METLGALKKIPAEERPYEKCLSLGVDSLSDAELLAVILKNGTKGESSVDLARKILSISNYEKSILGLCHLSLHELMKVKGIGKVKAIQILCLLELSKRITKKSAGNSLLFTSPKTVADYYMEDMRHNVKELLIMVMLNTKCKFIMDKLISVGTVNTSLISAREIFIEALKTDAVFILLVHNHPSGDPTPSKEDILVTGKIKEAGNLIGITLIDHIIIGDNCYQSLKETGLL